MKENNIKKYHPALVVMHWLLAFMVIMGLIMGGNVLSATPNSDPKKIEYLQYHMNAGVIILFLMIIRLVVRMFTSRPPEADIGHPLVNKLGSVMHYVLYVVVILMGLSGVGIAIVVELPDAVFAGIADLPPNFDDIPPRIAHGLISIVLTLLIAGHIAAFLYHQYIRKDALFSRMWFGKRT